jgi:hypothetical protein
VSLLLRTHLRPIAWIAALAAAAWPFGGPGDLVVQAITSFAGAPPTNDDATRVLAGALSTGEIGIVLARGALGLAGWIALAPITLTSDVRRVRFRDVERLVRTRGIGLMATTFTVGIAFYLSVLFMREGVMPALLEIGAAFAMGAATTWLAASDRFAFTRFDAAQDRRARADADAKWNAPYYLDTGSPGKGLTSVATGADVAVTQGGATLLSRTGWTLVLVWLALDALRALAAGIAGPWVGLAAGTEAALLASAVFTYALGARAR